MEPSLISLITQKKNVIKSTSIKGSEYVINKSIKTDNDLTCDTLRCNNIDIDPTQPTIITNAEINKSKINSTTIGLSKHTKGKFTDIVIEALTENKRVESFKLNGDILIEEALNIDNERQIFSKNPFKIKSSRNLLLESSTYLNLLSYNDIKFSTSNTIECLSNKININTSNFDINSKLLIINDTNVTSKTEASVVLQGGMAIQKDLHVYGNTNLLYTGDTALNVYGKSTFHTDLSVMNNLTVGNSTQIGKDIRIEGTLYTQGGSSFTDLSITGILSIENSTNSTHPSIGSVKTLGGLGVQRDVCINGITTLYNENESINNSTGSLIARGGVYIEKNLNVNSNVNISNTNNMLNVYSKSSFRNLLDIHNTLNVYGDSHFNANLNVLNNITISNAAIMKKDTLIERNLQTNGHSSFNTMDINGIVNLQNSQESTNINNGSLITTGGIGISKNLSVGGRIINYNIAEDSVNLSGGIYIKKNVNCNETIIANNANISYNLISNNIFTNNLNIANQLIAKISQPTSPNQYDILTGKVGLTNNLYISDAFYKIDNWINSILIDTPPAPTYINSNILNSYNVTSYSINLEWINPEQITVGFLNIKLPNIVSICVDYKLSSQPDSEYITINMNSVNITKIILYAFNNTNYSSSNIYHLFNIQHNIDYDFRVYCINNNTTYRPIKYLSFNQIKTTNIGVPSIPTNISFTPNINNPSQSVDILWDHSTDLDNLNNEATYPIIDKYNINYSSIISIRYPNLIQSNLFVETNTTNSIINNANNYVVLTNLFPGHQYNIKIKTKNLVNSNYSNDSSINFTTDYPDSPNFIDNNNLFIENNSNYHFNSVSGYSLDGNIFIPHLFNYNLLNNDFKTNIINDIRINENISTTDLNTSIIHSNINNINYNLNLNGFSYTNSSTNYQNNLNIIISNERDFYTGVNSGFYKTSNINLSFNNPKSFILPSTNNYELKIQQNLPYSQNITNTKSYQFYVDELNTFTSISNINIPSLETNYTKSYISGVPTFISGNLNINFISHNLTNNFLRQDKKLFDIFLTDTLNNIYSPNLNITHNTITNSDHYYYNLDKTKHNNTGKVLLSNTSSILFNDFSITLPNSNIGYTENLNIGLYGYNLHGKTTLIKKHINIRVDYNSFNVIYNLSNSNLSLGQHVHSGVGQYPIGPNINNINEYGKLYNHNENILNTSELQLVNGYFSTPYNNNTFLNYSNYYYNHILQYPNYLGQISTNYRYVTFKYTNLINDTNKITLEFINSNFTNIIENNVQIYIKIHNITNSYFNTGWLNANKSINLIGLNDINKNVNGTSCLSLYNYQSTNKKKYCYLPNGSTGDLYIRVGIKSNCDLLFSYIKVLTGFI